MGIRYTTNSHTAKFTDMEFYSGDRFYGADGEVGFDYCADTHSSSPADEGIDDDSLYVEATITEYFMGGGEGKTFTLKGKAALDFIGLDLITDVCQDYISENGSDDGDYREEE